MSNTDGLRAGELMRGVRNFEISDLARRLENLVRIGTVAEVDPDQAAVRAQYGETAAGDPVLTGWLPWLTRRAGDDRTWWAPSIDEQVLILSPSGELTAGVVLPALYRQSHPTPETDPGKHAALYRDGARVEYDADAHHLKAELPGGGTAELVADGGVAVTGNVTVTGDVTVSGNVAASGRIDATEDIQSEAAVLDRTGSMQTMRNQYNPHTHPPTGVTPQMN